MIEFGSVCSGIEAASVAWHPLGWQASWLAEIEAFPSAVLAHHYPAVPNLGDMTALPVAVLQGTVAAPDVLVGGTPCQAFSIAGLRQSLDDARGNLTLRYVELANAIDAVRIRAGKPEAIIVWENVPGVLSTKDNAFGCFLAGLAGEDEPLQPPGGRWSNAGAVYGPARAVAWRTLDAQYLGLAQRRRRVFVVASARNGFDPSRVLFEWESVRRDSAPRREQGEEAASSITASAGHHGRSSPRGDGSDNLVAGTLSARTTAGGGLGTDVELDGGLQVAGCITGALKGDRVGSESHLVVGTLDTQSGEANDHTAKRNQLVCMAHGQGGAEISTGHAPTLTCNHEAPIIAFSSKDSGNDASVDVSPTLRAMNHSGSHANGGGQVAVAFAQNQRDEVRALEVVDALAAQPGMKQQTYLAQGLSVRRLMPIECERLQGFPDNYTAIPHPTGRRRDPERVAADGPRYKALGNSMAVNVMRWIGQRITAELSR